jgi:hypothetical protein
LSAAVMVWHQIFFSSEASLLSWRPAAMVRFVRCRCFGLGGFSVKPSLSSLFHFPLLCALPHFKIFIFWCFRFVLEHHLGPFWFGTKLLALRKITLFCHFNFSLCPLKITKKTTSGPHYLT